MANSPAVTIDLSGSSWAAEPGPELTPSELADLLDAISETDEEEAAGLLPGDTGEMTDAELDAIISAAEAEDGMTYDALGDFNDAFTARAQADQARSDARAAAIVQDTLRLARRDEDRLARAVSRAQAGVYDTPAALGFALQSPAIELAVQTGRGMCGVPDELGRCSARYHDLECVYGTGVDWLAAGAPRETFQASLSNWAGGLNLSGQPMTIWDDPDDEDDVRGLIPASTVELAHQLSHDWGLDIDAPFIGAAGLDDVSLIRPPTAPVNAYDAMAESIGYGAPPPPALTRPGISELARDLGLR
jgi:hypothetical protein